MLEGGRVGAAMLLAVLVTSGIGASARAQPDAATTDAEVAELLESWEGVTDIEDLPLADLLDMPVTGSSRYEQRQSASPNPTTVITAEDIRIYGWRTLTDVLRSLRGVYVSNDRNYDYVGVRGFGIPGDYNTRLLVLIDGHRLNDAVYDSTDPGFAFPLDLADVERIEVIRGPVSSVYGANAFFGVINVITRSGARRSAVSGAARVGSLGYQSGWLGYGQRYDNGLDVAVSVSGATLDGERFIYFPELDDPATSDGIARGDDGEGLARALASARYGDLSFVGAFGWRKKDIPTGAFGTLFDDPGTWAIDTYTVLGLGWDGDLGDDWGLAAHATFNHYEYIGEYVYEYDLPPPTRVINRDETLGNAIGADLQLRKTIAEDYTFAVGADYRYLFDLDQRNFDVYDTGPEYALDTADRGWVLGAYLQAQARFFDDVLTIDAGGRFDAFHVRSDSNDFDTLQWNISPRAALIVSPTESTVIRALYGSAFRAANAYERFYTFGDAADGGAQLFNPDLDAERIQSVELNFEQYIGEDVRLLAGGYYYAIDDLIRVETVDALDNVQFNNSGTAHAYGAEAELAVRVPNVVRGWASYSVQRAEDESNERLTNSPTHLAKLDVAVPVVPERLFLSGEVQYMSRRGTVLGTEPAERHVLVNLTLFGREIARGLSFTATVRNLFDVRAGDPASTEHVQNTIPSWGRTFWIGLKYDFAVGEAAAGPPQE